MAADVAAALVTSLVSAWRLPAGPPLFQTSEGACFQRDPDGSVGTERDSVRLGSGPEAGVLDEAAVPVESHGGAGGPQCGPAAAVRSDHDRVRTAGTVGQRELVDPPVGQDAPDLAGACLSEPDRLAVGVDPDRRRTRCWQRVGRDAAGRSDL